MMRAFRIAAVAGALFSFSAGAFADVPAAMDRIPADVYLVTTIRNLEQFQSSIETLAGRIGLPPEALDQMGAARQLLQTPGLDPQGSASIAVLEVRNGGQNFVAVLPIRDYQAFVTGLGGTGEGIDSLELQGQTFFVKDLGGGFAAAGPQRGLVDAFEGRAGHAEAHHEFLGATGRAIADASGFFVVANIPALAPRIRDGMEQGIAQAQMMFAMMGGGGVDLRVVQEATDAFLRDATAGVMGLRAGEQGASLEFGAQFREGSELAGHFDAEGDARQLLSALPNQPYWLTMAVDASSPSFREVLRLFMPANQAEAGPMAAINPIKALELADGFSFLLGTTPAVISGAFLNSVQFVRTEDPQALMRWAREGLTSMHGQKLEGVSYQATMEEQEVGDRRAQAFSLRLRIEDPRNPVAQQAGRMQQMLFGPAGLSGYMIQTERGIITTYSRNRNLLEQALNAADTRTGLGEQQGIRQVGEHLPHGRTFEAYIGIGNILETAMGFMMLAGIAPVDVEIPADLQPVGLGGTTSNGGLRLSFFVPADVMATARKLREAFEDEEDWEEDDPETGLPRF